MIGRSSSVFFLPVRRLTPSLLSTSTALHFHFPNFPLQKFSVSRSFQHRISFSSFASPLAFTPTLHHEREEQHRPTPQPTTTTTEIAKERHKEDKEKKFKKENAEYVRQLLLGSLKFRDLENELQDPERIVTIRRLLLQEQYSNTTLLRGLPHQNYDYSALQGVCGENIVGYVPVPVGIAGPFLLDDVMIHVPMATTEGGLVASTTRGMKAITESGGAISSIYNDGMTRSPLIRLSSISEGVRLKNWLLHPKNYKKLEEAFNGASRFSKLLLLKPVLVGRFLHLRFKATSGDAMGMNMLCKGVQSALDFISSSFPRLPNVEPLEILSLSGNLCTDKKPSAVNWIEGRGKSVVCEAWLRKEVVEKTLKTTIQDLVELNIQKNLVGSALAGSIGGFNAHSSNVVSAVFIATGQDVAQNVESSNCITLLESRPISSSPFSTTSQEEEEQCLYMTCTMPSLEVGTVGGGTELTPQAACLDLLGCRGPSLSLSPKHTTTTSSNQIEQDYNPQQNTHAERLARTICGTVLAAELSLLSALSAGHLLSSHLALNRRKK